MNRLSRPLRSCNGISSLPSKSVLYSRYSSFARHPSPSAHKWSHPPSSTTIADDDVASLANQPLHALSLADLVKYILFSLPSNELADSSHLKAWSTAPLHRRLVLIRQLHALPPSHTPCPPNPVFTESAIHRRLESQYLQDLQLLPPFSVDLAPLQIQNHFQPRRRDPVYISAHGARRDTRTHDPNSRPRLSRMQEIHQPGRGYALPG